MKDTNQGHIIRGKGRGSQISQILTQTQYTASIARINISAMDLVVFFFLFQFSGITYLKGMSQQVGPSLGRRQ